MCTRQSLALLALACSAAAPFAHAASGSITGVSASASQVTAGGWVDLSVSFSVSADSPSLVGDSGLPEPAPQEGDQEWLMSWYSRYSESIQLVSLQAGGQSFSTDPGLTGGGGYSGSWQFAMQFDAPGLHTIGFSGDWAGEASTEYGAEVSSRSCYRSDPDSALACSGWIYRNTGGFPSTSSIGGTLGSQSLQIEVLAVPEPGTLALWLSGAGLLAWRLRRG